MILFLIIGIIFNNILNTFNVSQGLPYVNAILTELILAFIAVLLMKKLNLFNKDFFSKKNFKLGLKLGFFVILSGVLQLVIYLSLNLNSPMSFVLAPIIGAILYSFAIGIYEEIFMRGLILQNLMETYGYSKRGVYKALILASVFFGLAHLINLTHAPLFNTLIQVVYAMTAGVIFGAVFLRTRNLLSVIMLHSIFDLFTYLSSVVFAGHFVSYNFVQHPLIYLAYNGFLVIGNVVIGLIIARKIKPLVKDVPIDISPNNNLNDLKV